MTWIEEVSITEFVAEMRRKPDAELLIEWIDARLDLADGDAVDALLDARAMISVYRAALKDD